MYSELLRAMLGQRDFPWTSFEADAFFVVIHSGNPPKIGTFTAWNRTQNHTRKPPVTTVSECLIRIEFEMVSPSFACQQTLWFAKGLAANSDCSEFNSARSDLTSPEKLDGQNRQSRIASIQRTRSTLASHSAVPTWKNCSTNERQSRDANCSTTNARSVRTNFCVSGGDMTTN